MKKTILFSALILGTSLVNAEPTMRSSTKDAYGVSYSRIESRDLTAEEMKSFRMMASVDLGASASNVTTSPNKPVMVRSSHTACFSTMLTTEADYSFTLDIGGQQTVVSEHIVIPNKQRTCVTKELYKQVSFPSRGNYMFSATSSGTTFLAGKKETHSDAYIFVK